MDRCGYLLTPDYACTAHMVQGLTLPPGVIVDCGDIHDVTNAKNTLVAYVSLSQITARDTLLLVRMFSKSFFVKVDLLGHSAS